MRKVIMFVDIEQLHRGIGRAFDPLEHVDDAILVGLGPFIGVLGLVDVLHISLDIHFPLVHELQ